MDETRYEALGRFLRSRREALTPEQVGLLSRRLRRTPGLRREEVAFLADVGVKWYARLEAAEKVNASVATLTRIARALQLTAAEYEYVLDLAEHHPPTLSRQDKAPAIPLWMDAYVRNLRGIAVVVADRILTPLRWNAIADATHSHSRFEDPVERNALVRGLFDPELIAFLGEGREAAIRNAVGMLRRDLSSEAPNPLAGAVYERIKAHPLFQKMWEQRVVASEVTDERSIVRYHARVGRLALYGVDLGATVGDGDWFLRTLSPADEDAEAKFAQLEEIGRERGLRDSEEAYST
jgi:transcriptional regulator with XRE-family HTH domain